MMGLSSVVPLLRTKVMPEFGCRFSKRMCDGSLGLDETCRPGLNAQISNIPKVRPPAGRRPAVISALSQLWRG
jgi:hypothetical protein